jgi:hypothetical protein
MTFPKFLPAATSLLRSREGDVWIAGSSRADEDTGWYVVTPEGTVAARVVLPPDLELLEPGRDLIITKRRDARGVDQVLLFDLVPETLEP